MEAAIYSIDGTMPAFTPGTAGMRAIPRPDAPLTGIMAPAERSLRSTGMSATTAGEMVAELTLRRGHYHVVPQPGFQFTVDPGDVDSNGTSHPQFTYIMGESPAETNPTAPALQHLWSEDVPLVTLHRVRPAEIIGQIDQDARPGWMVDAESVSFWCLFPGAWIIRDVTRRNLRVADALQLGREFEMFIGNGNEIRL